MSQVLEPLDLYVIPRAKYAEWLAMKFLGQAMMQPASTSTALLSSTTLRSTSRSVEYLFSRPYQPGDSYKDIDWKHLCKLNEFIVKEYSDAQELVTIIAANLTVKDAEEADNLAYSLITLALTLAKVTVPTALAAYNHREVLLTTNAADPKDVLKTTLKLAQSITSVSPQKRFLDPPDVRKLKKIKSQLEQVNTISAQRLIELLQLEDDAIQKEASSHPATRALSKTAARVPPPAVIAVLSNHNHDAEALLVTLHKLEKQGYRTMKVESDLSPKLISSIKS
jgi:uncharacterized protein (DUF58 family)